MIPRQKIPMPSSFPILTTRYEVNESGKVEEVVIDMSRVELPDVETTDLRSLLDAGVDIKRVNPTILKGTQIVTDLSVESESNEGENNNEN